MTMKTAATAAKMTTVAAPIRTIWDTILHVRHAMLQMKNAVAQKVSRKTKTLPTAQKKSLKNEAQLLIIYF